MIAAPLPSCSNAVWVDVAEGRGRVTRCGVHSFRLVAHHVGFEYEYENTGTASSTSPHGTIKDLSYFARPEEGQPES